MDNLTQEQRRRNMQRIRSKDTSIEIRLRRALWAEGIRYRKNVKTLPGKPDIVIAKYKIAVFCDASFWHGRDFGRKPVDVNHEYWDAKIRRNMQRDQEVNKQLRALGWTVLRFWDEEINKNLAECVRVVQEAVFLAKLNANR